ncbi:MAG: hypothetical protein HQM16_09655 [Deltaproteobacteria bacterium]|nr:hypothetical protein [Deltaproteobacteria bacterium]
MSGIGVVLNPFSKKYKKNPDKLNHMAFIIGDKASCKPTDDLDDLYRVAEEFKTRNIDVLAISGGDGTIHCTLTTFINVYGEKPLPKIYFLRGGTLNTIAATMGIKGNTEKLMSDLLIRYHEDRPFDHRKLRLTKINNEYGCIFGMGVIFNFMDFYYSYPQLNPYIAAKALVRSILSAACNGKLIQKMFKRFDADVYVNGQKWPFANYTAVFSGSIRQLGLDFNVFNSMLTQNELFHAIGMSLTPHQTLMLLKKLHDGTPSGDPGLVEGPAQTMEIICAEPMPFTIDGDMIDRGVKEFKLSVGPEITVLV